MPKIYTRETWTDEVLSGVERYDIKTDAGSAIESNVSIDLVTSVAVAGTAVDAAKMNNIESAIDALDTTVNVDLPLTYLPLSSMSTANAATLTSGGSASALHIHKSIDVLSILTNNGNVAASSTSYAQYGLTGLAAGGVPNLPWPLAGIWKNLTVRISSTQPASGSLVITLMHNNVASALVVTIPANSGSASFADNTHTVTFAAGDLIYFRIVNNATGTSASITTISMLMESNVI